MSISTVHCTFKERIYRGKAISLSWIQHFQIQFNIRSHILFLHFPSNKSIWSTYRSVCYLIYLINTRWYLLKPSFIILTVLNFILFDEELFLFIGCVEINLRICLNINNILINPRTIIWLENSSNNLAITGHICLSSLIYLHLCRFYNLISDSLFHKIHFRLSNYFH